SFSFHDTAPSQIYTLSLHDALPISDHGDVQTTVFRRLPIRLTCGHSQAAMMHNAIPMMLQRDVLLAPLTTLGIGGPAKFFVEARSEEHTSELQSRFDLVCRLLLEKK